jgi:branched-chain amino acid transport system ATP-binding protein
MRLQIDRLSAGYGGTLAIRSVSLVAPAGKVVALLGPNGAGKTTLLSAVSGLVRPRSGRVLLGGEDVTGAPSDRLTSMGMCHVTEGRSVFGGLTVRDNLRLFARAGEEAAGIERAVAAFPKLGQRMNQLAGTMSGGEQQMLALARAYARRADVILLDEVSMGLAPIIVDEIFEFLARLASEGTSLVIVEQYVAKALELAEIVYVMVRGRIVLAGDPQELRGTDLFAQYLGSEVTAAGIH